MTLTLSALSLNDQPLTQPVVAHFDPPGGTIGRGDQNTLALPDPERHISRQHARIHPEGAGWRITNLSAANAVTVAGRSLAQGESAPVRHRDLVRIGGFLLEVRDESAPDENVRTITRGRAHVPRPAAPGPNGPPAYAATPLPSADALATPSAAEDDPFMALFGPALAASGPTPAAAPSVRTARPGFPAAATPDDPFAVLDQPLQPGAGPASSTAAAEADPFDAWLTPAPLAAPLVAPFAAPLTAPGGTDRAAANRSPAPPAGGDDLLASLGQDPSVSIDSLFGSAGGTDADLDAFLRQPVSPQATSTAPAAAVPPAPAASTQAALPDHVPDLQAALELPPPRREPVAPTVAAAAPRPIGPLHDAPPIPAEPEPPVEAPIPIPTPTPVLTPLPPRAPLAHPAAAPAGPSAPPDAHAAGAEALWRAFCEGSGAHFDPPQGLNPELMRVIGSLLRASVEGMVQLVAIRAATKHELRAEMTMIQARNNNPLKFSPDAQAALEQLLQPPMRGFMAGPAAVHDAMNDLVGHTIGTMAGMRAALEGVLQRFQPSVLEGKLVGSSVFDTLLPMNRRARLWELYLQHFESIRGEAQEDFHTLFGKAFVAAYEQQLDRLYEQQHAKAHTAAAAAAAAASRQPAAGPGGGPTHRG